MTGETALNPLPPYDPLNIYSSELTVVRLSYRYIRNKLKN